MNYNLTAKIQVKKLYGRVNRSSASEVKIALQDLYITESGTYTYDSEYDGLGTVVVDIPGVVLAENEKVYQYGTAASTWDMVSTLFESAAG